MQTLARYSDDALQHLVHWIAHPERVATISWGTRNIVTDGEVVNIPRYVRRCTVEDMYHDYTSMCGASDQGGMSIGRTSFFEVCGALTVANDKVLNAVDYVKSRLVHDTVETLLLMVGSLEHPQQQKELGDHVKVMSNFVKHQCKRVESRHVATRDFDARNATHSFEYVLGIGDAAQHTCDEVECVACKYVPWAFDQLKAAMQEQQKSSKHDEMINLSCTKIELYQAHCARAACQNAASDALLLELEQACRDSRGVSNSKCTCLFIADWKMKWLPKHKRQSTQMWFGQSGLPWHGVQVIWYTWDSAKEMPVQHVWYYHQVVVGCRKQDAMAVLSMVEAAMMGIRKDHPSIGSVILCVRLAFAIFVRTCLLRDGKPYHTIPCHTIPDHTIPYHTMAPREINPMFNGDLRKLLNILKLYSPSMFAVAQK